MNIKTLVYFSIFGLSAIHVNAQKASDELLKINNQPFTVGEFERIYTKNFDLIKDKDQKDIENYLDLFLLYKLKVAKAYELNLDKKNSFVNEYESHRKQLADQYLTNEETLERLAKEAYDRSNYEIKASHIIFLADEFSTPADTLKAYNKALDVRKQILNGLDFNEAAIQFSEDPSAKNNKGDLGYFSSLRMVYPFETAAYHTAVGSTSMPIRTEFGYHLIHVFDKRPKKGKREVAQIVIENKEFGFVDSNKNIIDEIYKSLEQGEIFEDLALKYSDDSTSKHSGGKFAYYEPGVISIEGLDQAVYDLNKPGDFSEPFKSQFGWHIVKLISEEEIPSYDKIKGFYSRKVQSDNRSRILADELTSDLKERYNYKVNQSNYNDFVKTIEKNNKKTNWDDKLKLNADLATFADNKLNVNRFVTYVKENNINLEAIDPISNAIHHVFENLVAEDLLTYYKNNLENEYPEFKYTAQEFKEGLLLFELMESEIWNKAKVDTLGYTKYYQAHLNDFRQEESIEGIVFSADKKSDIKKALKFHTKHFGKKPEEINEMLDVNLLVSKKGKFKKGDKNLPKNYVLKEGISEIFEQDGKYYFVIVDKYNPEGILTLDEARQNLIFEYQQEFEKHWLNSLKGNAKIEINNTTLDLLKTKYQQK